MTLPIEARTETNLHMLTMARHHAQREISYHLESANRAVILDALAQTGVGLLTVAYCNSNDTARLIDCVAIATALQGDLIADINSAAPVEIITVGENLRTVKEEKPLSRAVVWYCDVVKKRKTERSVSQRTRVRGFVFDVLGKRVRVITEGAGLHNLP